MSAIIIKAPSEMSSAAFGMQISELHLSAPEIGVDCSEIHAQQAACQNAHSLEPAQMPHATFTHL